MKTKTRIVELTKDVVDYGNATEFLATGVGRMFMISPSIVRIAFVRANLRDDNVMEQRVSGCVDFDIVQLVEINRLINEGLGTLLEPPSDTHTINRTGLRRATH